MLNNQLVGYKTKFKIVKNKVAAPFQMTVLDIYFDRGICKLEELISLGLKTNILQKNGSWYNYGEQKLGLGLDKVREFFIANVDLQEQLHCNVAEWLHNVK